MDSEIININNILLVEDDPRDAETALAAMEEHHLANKVAVVDNGAEVLDCLYRRGESKTHVGGNPIAVLLDNKMPMVSKASGCLGRSQASGYLRSAAPIANMTVKLEEKSSTINNFAP